MCDMNQIIYAVVRFSVEEGRDGYHWLIYIQKPSYLQKREIRVRSHNENLLIHLQFSYQC